MKSIIFAVFLCISFVPLISSAQNAQQTGFVPLAPIEGLTTPEVAGSPNLAVFFNNLYIFLVGLAAVLAVIMITWHGVRIAINQDNVSTILDSKGYIYNAIFGLLLVLSPAIVFGLINPSILNLSFNLPPITSPKGGGDAAGGGGVDNPAVSVPVAVCSVTGVAGVLQIATCPDRSAGQRWGQKNCLQGNRFTLGPVTGADGVARHLFFCTGEKKYTFTHAPITFAHLGTIHDLRPLVSSPDRPTNAEDAISFARICMSEKLKLRVCVRNKSRTTCNQHVPPSGWNCYKQTLTCERAPFGVDLSTSCSSELKWTPFP